MVPATKQSISHLKVSYVLVKYFLDCFSWIAANLGLVLSLTDSGSLALTFISLIRHKLCRTLKRQDFRFLLILEEM